MSYFENEGRYISASDVKDYIYCNRSWWLRRTGQARPQNREQLARGVAHHEAHGRLVQKANWSQKVALVLLFTAVVLLTYSYFAYAGG